MHHTSTGDIEMVQRWKRPQYQYIFGGAPCIIIRCNYWAYYCYWIGKRWIAAGDYALCWNDFPLWWPNEEEKDNTYYLGVRTCIGLLYELESGSLPCCSVGNYLHGNQHRRCRFVRLMIGSNAKLWIRWRFIYPTNNWCLETKIWTGSLAGWNQHLADKIFQWDEKCRVETLTLPIFFVRIAVMPTGEYPILRTEVCGGCYMMPATFG